MASVPPQLDLLFKLNQQFVTISLAIITFTFGFYKGILEAYAPSLRVMFTSILLLVLSVLCGGTSIYIIVMEVADGIQVITTTMAVLTILQVVSLFVPRLVSIFLMHRAFFKKKGGTNPFEY
jgi:hypothetical protein